MQEKKLKVREQNIWIFEAAYVTAPRHRLTLTEFSVVSQCLRVEGLCN